MKIGGLYTAQLVRADESDSLGSAAERMHIDRVGSLAVFSEDRLIGIITESDLVRAMADGANPETSTVSDYMTARPITVDVDEDSKAISGYSRSPKEVAQTMLAIGIRHLPVRSTIESSASSRSATSPCSRRGSRARSQTRGDRG